MKHFINILLLLVLAAGLACAVQLPTPYPAPYWINGVLSPSPDGLGPTTSSFQIIVYKVPALLEHGGNGTYSYLNNGAYATGTTGQTQPNGTAIFTINLLDDPNMGPLTTDTYYIGAVTKNGYGVNERLFQIHAPGRGFGGYSTIDMQLELGGIPPIEPPSDVPLGTVPLQIARATDGSTDIVISWVNTIPAYQKPKIYMLTGNGSGQFTNTYEQDNWKLLVSGTNGFNFDQAEVTDPLTGRASLRFVGQVGQGLPEAYFKALQANIDPAAFTTDTDFPPNTPYLSTAWAVGKMNYSFGSGNNYFNCPFVTAGDINESVGTVGIPRLCKVLKYSRATDDFMPSVLNAGPAGSDLWLEAFPMALGQAYLFFNFDANPITVTLLGDVSHASIETAIAAGNNLIGLATPAYKTLEQMLAGNAADLANLDGILTHQRATDDFSKIYYKDGAYYDQENQEVQGQVIYPTIGYFFARFGSSSFNWRQ